MSLQFKPAAENTGIVFRRADTPNSPPVEASILNRVSGPRRTTLVKDGCSFEMVEHVLSALAGLQIDNCEIISDRAEMPGMDGSSLPFVNALAKVGTTQQDSLREVTHVIEPVRVGDDRSWIQLEPSENNRFELCFHLDYASCPAIGRQTFANTFVSEDYPSSIAPARTFVLKNEADQLLRQGLGSRVTYDDILIFDNDGPIGNELRFSDECARHKVLDMIGDFSLLGTDIVGKFTAFKSGHRLNSQVVFELHRQRGLENPGQQRIPA